MKRSRLIYEVLFVFFGVLCAVYFLEITVRVHAVEIAALHQAVVEGSAPSPYRYRVLSTALVEVLRVFVPANPTVSINAAYTIGHAIAFPLMFVALFRWFVRWMSDDRAAFSVLIVGMLTPLGLMNWGTSLYTPLEVAFVALACLLVQGKPTAALRIGYGLLLALATLNRETGGILALIWLVAYWRDRGTFTVYLALFAAIQLGLRAALGYVSHEFTPAALMSENLGYWLPYGIRNNLFTLPLWALAIARWRHADARLRALMFVIIVYAAAIIAFGQWHEIRLQFAAFVILLPLAFSPGVHVEKSAEAEF